jgi:proline racemase
MRMSKLITAIDSHTAGMPMRVITGGFPYVPGSTILEKMRYVREHYDELRSMIVLEPRGHAGMFAGLLTEPTVEQADVGVVFLNPGGYDTMCGHGTIAICTVMVEMGMVPVREPETTIVLDTPAGIVEAKVAVQDGNAESVSIQNVPSFLYQADVEVDVPGIGCIRMDVAYGGDLFYAILPADSVDLKVEPGCDSKIISIGRRIWDVIQENVEAQHPEIQAMRGFAGVMFSAPPSHPKATLKNACFGPPGFTDRSPCGTGTCAKMASLYSRGELGLNEDFIHESIVGTLFRGRLIGETSVGSFTAVVPIVTGSAYVTGIQQFILDSRDPFPGGLYLGDMSELWGAA